ncbi:galactokinase [Shewanella sairae]|uniref:Galactokinase n=1 Tax=Shewanella sairae TaxID=190310 RepID=A0ABQ4PAQ5_9GAMM|nr:galactokinase [Shewanella sairae]MCL1130795.1 galactokinase [Shewanella sairae]GIU44618.1 galactokinase [Shewanella sairae]
MSNPAQRANKLFVQTFGTQADKLYCAPGRVNLIGEHTDYNDGFVLPAAINFHTAIVAKRRDDQTFRAVSDAFPGEIEEWTFGEEGTPVASHWSNYLKGFTAAMATSGLAPKGLDLAVVSNVPMSAGLSSSAALEVAFGTAVNDCSQIQLSPLAIAQLAQRGENQFVGHACGIMDQMISALGEQDHALLIDCLDLDSEAIGIPEDLSLIVINSKIQRSFIESKYHLRRQECEQAASHFGLESLRDLSLTTLESAKDELSLACYKRAKHVVTENRRTQNAAWALEAGDIAKLSQLMAESHISMRDDFEISTTEIDYLVEIVSDVVGNRGGVRMTGGGIGGCVVALVEHELTDSVVAIIEQKYTEKTGLEAEIYLCSASDGAKRIDD